MRDSHPCIGIVGLKTSTQVRGGWVQGDWHHDSGTVTSTSSSRCLKMSLNTQTASAGCYYKLCYWTWNYPGPNESLWTQFLYLHPRMIPPDSQGCHRLDKIMGQLTQATYSYGMVTASPRLAAGSLSSLGGLSLLMTACGLSQEPFSLSTHPLISVRSPNPHLLGGSVPGWPFHTLLLGRMTVLFSAFVFCS